ncbi:MAG TPA: GlsB/YeaQ/YmgE family stress response membrane protein [Woeseiaceae bacterium]|nr:GlsB/YeaQ/YmgE family stress response membrane protein [Woeseiaceae bacterium]
MGLITWIILGAIAGVIAKWIMPGDDPGGFIVTILLGIAGALIGGFIASAIGLGGMEGLTIGSIIIAILGAILLLFLYRLVTGNRNKHVPRT